MPKPVIIAVAITGSVPSKADNPAVPVTIAEQIESTHEAFEAGASLVHAHVRGEDGKSSSNPDLFAPLMEGVRKHCPGMIFQISTGGRGRDQNERGKPLFLKPEMASLATGSVNFATMIYENHPELVDGLAQMMLDYDIKPEIEIFDLAMLYNTKALIDRGLIKPPPHVQFVLGIPNALPARRQMLEFGLSELAEIMPGATWTAAGIARHQLTAAKWSLELGGHVRTGLEDNIKYDRTRLAASNAELVEQVVEACPEFDRVPATPAQAREILGLK
ncbi:MAG: 3-keto-5-aminohexanoate cleavage protein [Rhodospirillales bacterium]|nr:3-keto-5-aminohexanoate cleavage protein [Rhodospirillales bacterium]